MVSPRFCGQKSVWVQRIFAQNDTNEFLLHVNRAAAGAHLYWGCMRGKLEAFDLRETKEWCLPFLMGVSQGLVCYQKLNVLQFQCFHSSKKQRMEIA